MSATLASPIGPVISLLAGALALVLLVRWRQPGWHSGIAALSVLMAGLLWYQLRSMTDQAVFEHSWEVMVLPPAHMVWQVDGWAWLCGVLALLVTAIEILFNWDSAGWNAPQVHSRRLLALAAALLVVSSSNLLTIASMWILLEIALIARGVAQPQQAVVVSGAVGGLLVWLALSLSGLDSAQLPLTAGALASLPILFLLLACLWRLAFYPFHAWLLASASYGRPTRLTEFLLPATVGLALLGRIYQVELAVELRQPVWLAVGLVGLLGSSLAAWLDPNQERSLLLVAANRVTWCIVAMILSPATGQAAAAWPIMTVTLGLSGLVVGLAIARVSGWRLPLALAMLALIGIPATIGFPVRVTIATLPTLQDTLLPGLNILRWMLTLLADMVAVAAILRHWPAAPPTTAGEMLTGQRWLATRHLIGFVLVAAPLLALGLQPPLLARWLGLLDPTVLFDSWWAQMRGLSVWMWLGQGLAIGAGYLLSRGRPRLLTAQTAQQRVIAQVVDLDWLLTSLRLAGRGFTLAVHYVTSLLDGAGYVGWLALTVLLIWLLQTGT